MNFSELLNKEVEQMQMQKKKEQEERELIRRYHERRYHELSKEGVEIGAGLIKAGLREGQYGYSWRDELIVQFPKVVWGQWECTNSESNDKEAGYQLECLVKIIGMGRCCAINDGKSWYNCHSKESVAQEVAKWLTE